MVVHRTNPRGFGSTTYSPVQNLMVPEVAMRINRVTNFHHVIKNGQWVVRKLDFNADDKVTLRCRVIGEGVGHLYASFDNGQGRNIIAIKRVTTGFHDLEFVVPYNALKDFKVGVSTTIPTGYNIDLLPRDIQYSIRTNSLTMSQSPPMYESPGIGFAGLGAALFDLNKQSQTKEHWDGNLSNFNWRDAGYSGQRAVGTSTADAPEAFGEYHGYYAHRSSFYLARFNEADQFVGWMPTRGGNMGFTAPSGVPICMVMQHFVLQKQTAKNRTGTGRKKPENDREAKHPEWMYAGGVTPKNICVVSDSFATLAKNKANSDTTQRPCDNTGALRVVPRGYITEHFVVDGMETPVTNVASLVEWYDESSGTWSSPSKHPPTVPQTNHLGLTKVIFRFPRQLSSETDKDVLEELMALGVDYNYNATKQCYPHWSNSIAQVSNVGGFGFALLGRPQDADTVYEENQNWYIAPKLKTKFDVYFQYDTHPKAGIAGNDNGGPKPGFCQVLGSGSLNVTDAEKMARMNNPELFNAFYPLDGFKTGSILVAIGRGLSTSSMSVLGTTVVDPLSVPSSNAPIGTNPAARLKPAGVILTTDLGDDRVAINEEAVLNLWKQKFGVPLTKQFFSTYSLRDQDPDNPHMYKARDPESGLYYSAPYQIMYFEIPTNYSGPYVAYETVTEQKEIDGALHDVTKLVVKEEQMPYALKKGQAFQLTVRTPYGYTRSQKIDVVAEVEQQIALADAGLSPEDQMGTNELDERAVDVTETIETERQEQEYLRRKEIFDERNPTRGNGGTTTPIMPATPSGRRYVRRRDMFKINPQYYARESQLRESGFLSGLGAFTNSRAFYVEDVTNKWGSMGLAGYTQGLDDYDTHTELVPIGAGATDDFAMPPSEYAEKQALDILDVMENLTMAAASSVTAARHASNFDASKAGAELVETGKYALNAQKEALDLEMKTVARTPRVAAYAAQEATSRVEDYMPFGSYRGLGEVEESLDDKLERYGSASVSFGKGAASKLFEGTAIQQKFSENPLLYGSILGALLLLGTPFIGPTFAKTVGQSGAPLVKGLVKVPGAVVEGVVESGKGVANALVPLKRDTKPRTAAARRRASRKR